MTLSVNYYNKKLIYSIFEIKLYINRYKKNYFKIFKHNKKK